MFTITDDWMKLECNLSLEILAFLFYFDFPVDKILPAVTEDSADSPI